MISFEDCVALCGLSESEVAAIAEHEHIPETAAASLASYLGHCEHGPEMIRSMIVDDIRLALNENRVAHAAELFCALQHYLLTHAEARAGLIPNIPGAG